MRRTSLIKRGPLPVKYVLLITFIFFNIFTVFSLIVINKNLEPTLRSIAETKARQIATQAINDAVAETIAMSMDPEELMIVREGGPESVLVSTNYQLVNKVVTDTNSSVQRYIGYLEDGNIEALNQYNLDSNIDYEASKKQHGIVYNIPLGMATQTTLFSNLGPKIPIKFVILGDVISDVETKVLEPGINNTLLDIYLNVSVTMNIVIPLIEEPIEVNNSVKLGDMLIPGKVPLYYNGNGSGSGAPVPIILPDKELEKNNNNNN